ncbi:hypothetical protein SCP_0307680 [Sparassis crispa]|uniref:Uncharacterized protein n=1 Tax=Sparassis crispa TaxID=139825 RepID=A0A401GFZ3_9APHY|nr:hypothetical protein SCP_0307680 [Sparassis crispa]GBE81045.1 hypothetical protein SCP_0307680 [Sparassis crispa]
MQVQPSVFVSRLQKMVEGQIVFWCQGDGFPESAFELAYTTNMLPIPSGMILTDSDASVILQEALDLLAYDLIVGIIAASANSSAAIDSFLASGNVSFQRASGASSSDQQAQQYNLMLSPNDFQAVFSNDSILDYDMGQVNLPVILNGSSSNYLQALTAAFLADIGIWNVGNIFASPELLNATIDRNDPVSAELSQNPALYLWQDPLEPGAQVLRTGMLSSSPDSPIIPTANQSSAVIALSYLCQVQQRKELLDLIISVIVADASMFGAFWGIFMFAAATLVNRRSAKANYCDAHAEVRPTSMTSGYSVKEVEDGVKSREVPPRPGKEEV